MPSGTLSLCPIGSASRGNLSPEFSPRSDTNRAVQPQKTARGLTFRISDKEVLYYLCSENKDADQLRGNNLRLCFRICKKQDFPLRGSNLNIVPQIYSYRLIINSAKRRALSEDEPLAIALSYQSIHRVHVETLATR